MKLIRTKGRGAAQAEKWWPNLNAAVAASLDAVMPACKADCRRCSTEEAIGRC